MTACKDVSSIKLRPWTTVRNIQVGKALEGCVTIVLTQYLILNFEVFGPPFFVVECDKPC